MRYLSKSEQQTYEIGRAFAKQLQANDVVALFGDLGAGKTWFTKGMAKGMGIDDYVTSPTFALLNEYPGKIPLYHFDMYRITDADGLSDIGFYDYLEQGGVCVIEWSENILPFLPESYYRVEIKPAKADNQRVIAIEKIEEKV
jgi:tRNA threonylcarbamoyladenosine biosynthesis protein TsaE